MIAEPPLGRLVTLTALSWEPGHVPTPGIWLRTENGRTSYEVVEVRPRRTTGFVFRCRRWPRGREAEGAHLAQWFTWTWASRDRRGAAGS